MSAGGGSCNERQVSLAHDDGDPSPVRCRRMELLGFTAHGRLYFCVHQVSVELWNLHDTPRVSVQKKIIDLDIHLQNCTREQIYHLRKAGIIQNFRATMISMSDTERLYDALEQSRLSRGLQKHALKKPDQRYMRAEELRARKLKFHPFSESASPCGERSALIGEPPDDDCVVPATGPLLVAGSAERAHGMYNQWEHLIERRIGFDAECQAAGFPGGSRENVSVIRTSVNGVGVKPRLSDHGHSVQSDSDCSDVFIVSDSEKDGMDRHVAQCQPAVPRDALQPRDPSPSMPPKRTAVVRKGPVTKLWRFAQQGSPRWRAEQKQKSAQGSEELTPLVISIPLSKLKANRKWTKLSSVHRVMDKPRLTALCSFATMKRATNCWPTFSTSPSPSPSSNTSSTSSDNCQGSEAHVNGGGVAILNAQLKPHPTTPPTSKPPVDSNKDLSQHETGIPIAMAITGGGGGDMCEDDDDVTSAAVCLSPSTGNEYRKKGTKSKPRVPRPAANNLPVKSTFSFEDVFGYYPPRLVVRNGQLEPAYSLSVKSSDHSMVPEAHPILKWTLGRPVRGLGGPRKARKAALTCAQ